MADDPFDRADADGPTRLAKLLCGDVEGGVGVEEAMTDDLADDFITAAVVAFGSPFLADQSEGAAAGEGLAELKVALFAEAELLGRLGGPGLLALDFDKHGEAEDNEVIWKNGKLSGGTDDPVGRHVKLHGMLPP